MKYIVEVRTNLSLQNNYFFPIPTIFFCQADVLYKRLIMSGFCIGSYVVTWRKQQNIKPWIKPFTPIPI